MILDLLGLDFVRGVIAGALVGLAYTIGRFSR